MSPGRGIRRRRSTRRRRSCSRRSTAPRWPPSTKPRGHGSWPGSKPRANARPIQLEQPLAGEVAKLDDNAIEWVLADRPGELDPRAVRCVAQTVEDPAAKPPSRRGKGFPRLATPGCGRGRTPGREIPAPCRERARVASWVALSAERRADVHERVRPGGGAPTGHETVGEGLEMPGSDRVFRAEEGAPENPS